MTLPAATDLSWRRCPRTTCDDYGKRLQLDVGQHEDHGDLRVRHWCLCGYQEWGPRTPTAARSAPGSIAALLYRIRRDGVEIPMRTDIPAVEEAEFDDARP